MFVYEGIQVYSTKELAILYEANQSQIVRAISSIPPEFLTKEYVYIIQDDELEKFKQDYPDKKSLVNSKRVLRLWTLKGALLLSRVLHTPRAWQIFQILIQSCIQDIFVMVPLIKQYPNSNIEEVIEWYKSAGEAYTKAAQLMENLDILETGEN